MPQREGTFRGHSEDFDLLHQLVDLILSVKQRFAAVQLHQNAAKTPHAVQDNVMVRKLSTQLSRTKKNSELLDSSMVCQVHDNFGCSVKAALNVLIHLVHRKKLRDQDT